MQKLLALIVGVVLASNALAVAVGLSIALIVVAAMAASLLLRRDRVPVVYNLRSLRVRRWTTLATGGSLALVTSCS
jgi:hypothetical protein